MKLARKITLLLLATFLALLAVLSYFHVRRAVRQHNQRVTTDLAVTGRALRSAFVELWQAEGEPRARSLLERANADARLIDVRWAALDFSAVAPSTDTLLSGPQIAALRRGQEVVVDRHEAGQVRLYVYVPVPPIGAIQLSQLVDEQREVVLGILQEGLALTFALTITAALLSVIVGIRVVGRPMSALADQARRIGQGDLTQRLALERNDEIGILATEMNAMCDRLAVAHDRILAEADARLKAVEQLRHADRLSTVGTLASGMAHELGTPLSIIAGRAKMITADETSAEEAQQFARIIMGQTDRMTKTMRGLLDFARHGGAPKVPDDLRNIARSTLELLAPLAKKQQVEVRLGDASEPAVADVDVALVEQALANLVVNGIHAMKQRGELLVETRRVRAKPPADHGGAEGDYVRVSVRDEGEGIAANHMARIFEPFFTTKDVGEGTGLGLSVTYGIMKDHGGWVEVESAPGKGSCFSLYFPGRSAS
jgi:signal transduction histidine kinase